MSIQDDLLPGDEDAILAELDKPNPTTVAAEAIKNQFAAWLGDDLFKNLAKSSYDPVSILNRDTSIAPLFPTQSPPPLMSVDDDYDASWTNSYLSRWDMPVIHNPRQTYRITSV